MADCYLANYPPLDLTLYEGDRNYDFYVLQNKYLKEQSELILWQMFPFIEGVVKSLAKKNICKGCSVPDFEGKSLEAALIVMNKYKEFPYYRAESLETVCFYKVREIFLNKNLQLEERTKSYDYLVELRQNKEEKWDRDFEKSNGFFRFED